MVNGSRLAFAWILLSLTSSAALAQSASSAYLDEEVRKRLEEIEKDIREINHLLRLRSEEPEGLPWDKLGITAATATEAVLVEPYTGGVAISKVAAGSPGEEMALRVGDVIVEVDGLKTPTLEELIAAVDKANALKTRIPKFVIIRDGELSLAQSLARTLA